MQVVGIVFESTNVCGLEALWFSKDDGGVLKWNSDAKFAVYRGICAQSSKQLALASYLLGRGLKSSF